MGKGLGGAAGRGENVDSGSSTVCDCHTVCPLCVCVWRVALCCTAGDAFVAVSFYHFQQIKARFTSHSQNSASFRRNRLFYLLG